MSGVKLNYMQYIEKIRKEQEKKIKEITKIASDVALKRAYSDFFVIAKDYLMSKYEEIASDFYNNYSPTYYTNRNESLKKILKIDITDKSLSGYFDESAMVGRNGFDDLYDLVFKEGYHGGARFDNVKGLHPDSGTPYYRVPHPYYKYWGRPAEQEDQSPYERFIEEKEKFEKSDAYKNVLNEKFVDYYYEEFNRLM